MGARTRQRLTVYPPSLSTPKSSQVGLAVDLEAADFTLAKVLDMGLATHLDAIAKVGDVAVKELAIEEASGDTLTLILTLALNLTLT